MAPLVAAVAQLVAAVAMTAVKKGSVEIVGDGEIVVAATS